MAHTLVGIGEALFDVFDDGPRLGGAPLNVAVHAHQLLAGASADEADGGRTLGRGLVVSRIGQDDLGDAVVAELTRRGMPRDGLQTDPDKPTGRVQIERQAGGGHRFHILPDQAYDWIQPDPDLLGLARSADAVAFGTLAQRNGQSRQTIQRFVRDAADGGATVLFDVNLRASGGRDFYSASTVRAGCELARYVKLNDEELATVNRLTHTADAADLVRRFDLDAVIYTRGADGTAAYTADGLVEGEPASITDPEDGADTVGAGDSCTAAFLAGTLRGLPLTDTLTLANRVAAYVAGRRGATPELPDAFRASLA